MIRVRAGDIVLVHFRGRLADGEEFGSSAGRGPIRFTAGGSDMIRGLSDGVLGMGVGGRSGSGPRRASDSGARN
jgi:peptidylprolyl isomerase